MDHSNQNQNDTKPNASTSMEDNSSNGKERNEAAASNPQFIYDLPVAEKMHRRFSMERHSSLKEGMGKAVRRNSLEAEILFHPSRMVSSNMLKTMLDDPPKTKVSRRSTMDMIFSTPQEQTTRRTSLRPSRRMSLDSMITSLDPDKLKTDVYVTHADTLNKACDCDKAKDVLSSDTDFTQISSDIEFGDFHEKENLVPNSPHTSIEYPPLYFLLRSCPRVLNFLELIYKVRWEMRYPLQRRIPLSKKLRKIGITATWGEAFLLVPFIFIFVQGLLTTFLHPSVSKSGIVSRLPLIICFLTANHNSLLTLFLGIPFERAIKYHKISGYLAFINGAFHTYVAWVAHTNGIHKDQELTSFVSGTSVNMSGTLLLCIICSMIITASPYVRRKAFEVFYYCHIAFAITMMGCAFYHSGALVPALAATLWGGDLLVRKVYMARYRYPRKAKISQLTDTVVEVKIPKTEGFDYNPGQYVKVAFPKLSVFEWHPISISSSPYQHHVTLHIRKRGTWTKKLHDLAGKIDGEVDILFEGPYGSVGVDLTSDRYSMVMLLSGGIGVTPMQSIAHQLMYEHEWNDREMKKLWFIWTARDPEVMEQMDVVTTHHTRSINSGSLNSAKKVIENSDMYLSETEGSCNYSTSLSSYDGHPPKTTSLLTKKFTGFSPCHTTDEELEKEYPLEPFMVSEADEELHSTESPPHNIEVEFDDDIERGLRLVEEEETYIHSIDGIASVAKLNDMHGGEKSDVLDLNCYVTAKEMKECGLTGMPFLRNGRPDMKKIFLQMRKEAIANGEKRVAVCVCAPTILVKITREACVKYSNRHVRFDFHSEVFD